MCVCVRVPVRVRVRVHVHVHVSACVFSCGLGGVGGGAYACVGGCVRLCACLFVGSGRRDPYCQQFV